MQKPTGGNLTLSSSVRPRENTGGAEPGYRNAEGTREGESKSECSPPKLT